VREDAEVGLPLLKLTATDEDDGDNGRVRFVLCGQSANSSTGELFAVSSNTGWLSTAEALDYETVQQVIAIHKKTNLLKLLIAFPRNWICLSELNFFVRSCCTEKFAALHCEDAAVTRILTLLLQFCKRTETNFDAQVSICMPAPAAVTHSNIMTSL